VAVRLSATGDSGKDGDHAVPQHGLPVTETKKTSQGALYRGLLYTVSESRVKVNGLGDLGEVATVQLI
jgi:hypothetical protein